MAKRGSQPALYEMMRSRPVSTATEVTSPDRPSISMPPVSRVEPDVELALHEHSPAANTIVDLFRPGRTIRVPVGYLFLLAGAMLAVIVLAYLWGNRVGANAAREDLAANFGSPPLNPGVNDPLTLEARSERRGADEQVPRGTGSEPGGSQRPSPNSWGPIEPRTDPRQKGVNYFILAETTPQGALRLAEFCRQHGLETYVVTGKNARRRVIAFPGYQGSRLDPAVKALEDRIHLIGDKYKNESKGETNMRDAYPSRYDG